MSPPLLRIIGHRDLELRRNTLNLEEPLLRIHVGLQHLVVSFVVITGSFLFQIVLLVHEVVFLPIRTTRHVVLAHRLDLCVAVHLGLVGKALVRVVWGTPLKVCPPEHLLEQAVEDLAHAVSVARLQLAGNCLDLHSGILQDDQHVCDHRVRIVVLVPVGLQLDQSQAPGHQLGEVLELEGWVCRWIRKERSRQRFHLFGAEPSLVVQQHEHVHNFVVELQSLSIHHPLRGRCGWGGHRLQGSLPEQRRGGRCATSWTPMSCT
mmetsp:Transcript_52542/g.85140  ORF Transcript_52542/g.85140 Transcript_52542/m.85140 type:complete len:263 (-) Transcript_52542:2-790(-)